MPKKNKKSKEKVCETFEIEKKGKEKTKTVCGEIEKKQASKEELKKYNHILKTVLIVLAALVILIFVIIYLLNSGRYFEYRGINGEVVKEGKLIFYRVPFPVTYEGKIRAYNIYLRNNPEKLDEEIPFIFNESFNEDGINFGIKFNDEKYRLVLNMSDEFDCEGDEGIAVINLLNLKALGIKVVKDENASCDAYGRYMFVNVKKSDKSEINQIGKACYELNVNNCEILKVIERLMTEIFVKYYESNNIEWKFQN